jgi:hypothetical protein
MTRQIWGNALLPTRSLRPQTPDPRPFEKMLATYVLQQLDGICAEARDAALGSCSIRYRRVNVDLGPACS